MKQLVRVFALFLALAFAFGMMPFSASAEEGSEETLCKVLVWTDANGEHVIPYTDLTGWDREMARDLGGTEYQLYNAGVGTYSDYYEPGGFRGRYISSDPRGSYGLALVQIGDVLNPGTSYATNNTYEMKINRSGDFFWYAGVEGDRGEYPVKGIIFYDPNSTTDDPVNASIDTSKLDSSWYGKYPPACHVSGADGAALYEAITSGMVVVKAELREHNYQGGHCTVCGAKESDVVATVRVGDTVIGTYTTLDDAITAAIANENSTVVAERDCDTGLVSASIESGTFTIDLNGKTIGTSTNYNFRVYGGNVTIIDSVGGGKITHRVHVSGGTLTIRGGTHELASAAGNQGNPATLIITGGEFDLISVTIGSNAQLSGGSYGEVEVFDAVGKPDDLLADGYWYYDEEGHFVDAAAVEAESRWYSIFNVTVAPECTHEGNTNTTGTDNGDGTHSITCSACSVPMAPQAHTFNAEGICTVCGHVCQHETCENGFCTDCGAMDPDVVASVTLGDTVTYYLDLRSALDAAEAGTEAAPATLTLLKDIALDTEHFVEAGVFTLDLNGFELSRPTGYGSMLNIDTDGNVQLTVTDTSEAQTGKLTSVQGSCIYQNGGIVNIAGGTFSSNGDFALFSQLGGTMNITGGTILCGEGTLFGGESPIRIGYQGSVIVSGGTISGGNYDFNFQGDSASLVLTCGDDGVGATFPGGIGFYCYENDSTLASVLAEGAAYWQNGKQLKVNNSATEITGGDVSVKAICDHSGNTNTTAVDNGDGTHSITCSVCDVAVPADHTPNEDGLCTACGYQYAACVTIGDDSTYCVDYDEVQDMLYVLPEDGTCTVTMFLDLDDTNCSSNANIHAGTVTWDLNGCTVGRRFSMLDGVLTVVDSAETKGTVVNFSGAAFSYYGGQIIIDASVDCLGETEGHEAWQIFLESSENAPSVGTTGSEDIVLPEGCVLLDISMEQELTVLSGLAVIHRHADEDTDHNCDNGCDIPQGDHTDADTDHDCDYGCAEPIGDHEAAEGSHDCGYCGEAVTDCADENADGKCDICGELLGVIRLAGEHRWNTAIKVADEMKANLGIEKFDAIIIASGNDFADALAGSYLSTVKNAPILLAWGQGGAFEYLDTDNINYIKENLSEDGVVYILGGEKAVPALYESELATYEVKRLGGADRFETNILILEEAGIPAGSEVLVCTSTNFADSLSASATAKPILLAFNEFGALFGKQPEFLAKLEDCTFTVIGGENAVGAKLVTAIEAYGEVTRLAGANRFETSVLVAEKYFEAPETAVLAYAWNYPDGLCGGSLAYSLGAPLILTMTGFEDEAVAYAESVGITAGVVLGGDGLISDEAVRAIFAMDAEDEIILK